MNNTKFYSEGINEELLPEAAVTQSGVTFYPRESVWKYRDGVRNVKLDFRRIENASADILLGFKFALIWLAENSSPYTVGNMFSGVQRLVGAVSDDKVLLEITDKHLMNYHASLGKKHEYKLGQLSGFLKQWYALSGFGIAKEAVDYLDEIKLSGNEKGVATATLDPVKGPFSLIERNALRTALDQAYADGSVATSDYLLCLIFMFFGPRPVQVAALKVCDISVIEKNDDSLVYLLRIPSAKKRQGIRELSRQWKIGSSYIGQLLYQYAQEIRNNFDGKLKDLEQAPLFPSEKKGDISSGLLAYHRTANSIGSVPKRVWKKLNVRSERTGSFIHATPSRFRDTVGTVAASEGWGEFVIAELLDHADTQNVGNYVGNSPEIIKSIDKKMAMKLAPLAQAFAGNLAKKEDLQGNSDIQHVIAPQYTKDFSSVGKCGQYSHCSFSVPLGCYTCKLFTAWLDGPHEQILDELIAERKRLGEVNNRVASVNDITILAIADVVEQCEQIKKSSGCIDA
ncbi:site-specific integrase [Halodesulfovibrio sp.]|uniref:site-specific integrase n=1 Tax=Halodesulfovibrio sp. TaxID=1912772 RepID=UPI0025BE8E0F|nr:site-specific integrase [Halodesulfovibrio sp.]